MATSGPGPLSLSGLAFPPALRLGPRRGARRPPPVEDAPGDRRSRPVSAPLSSRAPRGPRLRQDGGRSAGGSPPLRTRGYPVPKVPVAARWASPRGCPCPIADPTGRRNSVPVGPRSPRDPDPTFPRPSGSIADLGARATLVSGNRGRQDGPMTLLPRDPGRAATQGWALPGPPRRSQNPATSVPHDPGHPGAPPVLAPWRSDRHGTTARKPAGRPGNRGPRGTRLAWRPWRP